MLSPVGCIVEGWKGSTNFSVYSARNSFFGDDSKAINFGTSNAAGGHVAAGLPNQTAVFQCAKMRFIATDNLSVFRLFFSLPTARRVRDSFVDWKNLFRRRRRERKFIGRFVIFRQKLKVGWIDRRSGDRQLPYSLWGISVKRLERRKIRGACRRVVKWRPRGCLGVRLERVNRKLKPFKCKGEETVFTFLSLFVTI